MRLKIRWVNGWAQLHGTGPDGRRIRRALKTQDARRAEELRSDIENQLWKASLYGPESIVTFEECAVSYAQDGGEARHLVPISEQLAGMKLKDITPKAIRDAAKRAYPNAAPATLNRQGITPARAVINYGHEQGWCAPIRVRAFPSPKPKRVAVQREYLDTLKPHLPDRLYALMMFLHSTGRRVGEAISLTPEQISDVHVFIPKTKNGDAAHVQMIPEVRDLVASLEPRHGRVFGYVQRSSVYNTLRRAAKKAGVEYLGTHQPGRHSFATTLSDAGWGAKAIAEAGGWKSARLVAETYEHPTDPQAKAAKEIGKILTSKDGRSK